MCLGVPGRVVEIDGLTASVDFWGVKRKVRLETVDEPVQLGDYVMVHVGFAIRRIPQEQIKETLDLYNQLIAVTNQDLMAVDIQAEVAATGKIDPSTRAPAMAGRPSLGIPPENRGVVLSERSESKGDGSCAAGLPGGAPRRRG